MPQIVMPCSLHNIAAVTESIDRNKYRHPGGLEEENAKEKYEISFSCFTWPSYTTRSSLNHITTVTTPFTYLSIFFDVQLEYKKWMQPEKRHCIESQPFQPRQQPAKKNNCIDFAHVERILCLFDVEQSNDGRFAQAKLEMLRWRANRLELYLYWELKL